MINTIAYAVALVNALITIFFIFGMVFRDARLVRADGSRTIAPLLAITILAGLSCLVAIVLLVQ